ncbi:hypothetical protein PG994_002646 [Apiospora phragmitis]|uniref:CENP-V/GFA domain-containing protein n=1 Tax=Apiospora phragmitis TaxID=2905665 RepID=A0ABR1W5S6_9PEZI
MPESVAEMPESTIALLSKAFNHDKAAPSGPHETKKVAARCHCGAVQFSVSLPVASLPLRGYICHCSICRYTQGTYARNGVVLPPVAHPRLPQVGPDGGLVEWLLHPDDTAAVSAQEGEETIWYSPDHEESFVAAEPECAADGTERLRAECHCGGVSFTIPRPSQDILDDEYLRDYVSPADPAKWKAFLDLCRDCGRLSGANAVPWMLVPRVVIEPPVPADLDLDLNGQQQQQQQQQQPYGTLKTYQSSAPNTRGFCGVCGATVFLATKHRAPTAGQAVLNVAMGLLRAPEGVKAGDWVTWRTGKPAWAEDARAYDEEFTVGLVEGHRRWGLERDGEALEFDVI